MTTAHRTTRPAIRREREVLVGVEIGFDRRAEALDSLADSFRDVGRRSASGAVPEAAYVGLETVTGDQVSQGRYVVGTAAWRNDIDKMIEMIGKGLARDGSLRA